MAEMIPKITPEDIAKYGVVAAPDRLEGDARENKMVFDRLVREMVAGAVNTAIDVLNNIIPKEEEREVNEESRKKAEEARVLAEEARVKAEEARMMAENGRASEEEVRKKAETARVLAEEARVKAEEARGLVEKDRVAAENNRKSAELARVEAERARVDENTGIVAMATAQASRAAGFAGQAVTAAAESKSSADNAKTSETNAKTSEGAAKVSETKARTSETNAKTSETNAKTSETNAGIYAGNASTSEAKAKASETNAKTSETNAANSERAAKESEGKVNTAETNAKNSELEAKKQAEKIKNMKVAVNSLPPDVDATVEVKEENENLSITFGIPDGEVGPTGIHVGETPPEDETVKVWVDTTEESPMPEGAKPTNKVIATIQDGISVIDAGLVYTRGIVEVRVIGDMLWVIDSGVYNFTDAFKTAKNRTVLQFEIPKDLSNRICNVNGVFGGTGTISYFPALAYENVTYTTFNCQSYVKRSGIGEEADTYQLVYTGLSAVSGGGLCGFHLKLPIFLYPAEEEGNV